MELTHVDLDERVGVTEKELGQRLGQLGLSHAGRPGEDERARRPLRVFKACAGAPDRLGDRLDGVILADDALVKLILHAQQARGLLFGQLEHRNAGPVAQNFSDLFVINLGDDIEIPCTPLLFALCTLRDQLLLFVPQRRSLLEVLRIDRGLLLPAGVGDPLIELAQIRRSGHPADSHPGPGLIDQVDRLVGQEPIVDIAVCQGGGGHDRRIGDRDPVMRLVAITQALEDLNGVRHRRFTHLDGLEPTLQRGVLLDVLAVLIERGRADGLQLPARQFRLEDGGRVDSTLCGARSDEGVQLVNE